MARVSAEAVRELIKYSGTDDALDAFIDTATTLVDTHLLSSGQSVAILTKIELYLAAHLVALSEELGGIIRDAYGSSSVSLANVYDAGFKSTRFGQVALALDASGTLSSLSTNKLLAQFRLI